MAPGTTALRLGDYNQQVVLDVIRTVPGVSRTDIAERTGLTAQAISKIVRRLADQDLIQESGTTIPSTLGGRPATGLCINPGARYAVGVHVDRDETAYTLLDLRGTIVARNRRTTPQSGPAAVVRQVAGEVPRLLQSADVPPAKVLGIGVGAPGPLDPVEGVLHSPPGMRGWGTVPLRDLVRERTGSPVWLDNDAVAAAIGESWNARTRRAGSMLFVYLGWGVGAALLIDGHPHRGSTVGSDLYHVPVEPEGPLCACGSRGCVGLYVSPAKIIDAVRALRPDDGDLDYVRLCEAAHTGPGVERRVVTHAADMLRLALIGVTNIIGLDLLVIGGSALEAARFSYEPRIRRALGRSSAYLRGQPIRIEISAAGGDVGAVGAASMVFHAVFAPRIAHA
jgi:predicted NBD/HSP70 family sugar kinase